MPRLPARRLGSPAASRGAHPSTPRPLDVEAATLVVADGVEDVARHRFVESNYRIGASVDEHVPYFESRLCTLFAATLFRRTVLGRGI